MGAARGEFSSRFGFVMAAAGSAVGLGNIWGFPTQAASNGGAAFLLVYLVLAFCLAYPALMAELIIGRHAKANIVTALEGIATGPVTRRFATLSGLVGVATATIILSFYSIVAGWMMAFCLSALFEILGFSQAADWLTSFGLTRNLTFTVIFMALTVAIICGGVKGGIERWSSRLMPSLLLILCLLIVYVLTLDGAAQGIQAYLVPDFSKVTEPSLIISALGQSFFSMSLGVGTMLIYGSYVSKKENIVALGRAVTLIDIGIAVLAGLLIIPAMYVAQHNGVQIFNEQGALLAEDTLIFTVLPALFENMGLTGIFVSFAFFILMSIAALTSSISMLEAPVAYVVESKNVKRTPATILIGLAAMIISIVLMTNFSTLFGLAVSISTQYSQPLLGLCLCIFTAWIWHRDGVLKEIQAGNEQVEESVFWKIWPSYVKFVCPIIIVLLFSHQFFS